MQRKTASFIVALIVAVSSFSGMVTPAHAAASGSGNYNNSLIADHALSKVGQTGGQCRAFVNAVIKYISGGAQNPLTNGGSYFQSFLNAGGVRITAKAELRKGDVVQYREFESMAGLHTWIIVGHVAGDTYDIVDSNRSYNEKVQRYHRTFTLGDQTRAYRMGKIPTVPTPPPATPADGDRDGVTDANDRCLEVPGKSYLQGCAQPMAQFQGDYNGDKSEDMAAFYVYPERGNAMGLFVWKGNGSGAFADPVIVWYNASGWESDRVIPAGSGDFNRDGRADLAMFYRYPDTTVRLFAWLSQADGAFADPLTGALDLAMAGEHLVPLGSGDYTGDGIVDVASVYRYPERGNAIGIFVWRGLGNGTFAAGASKWYTPTGWDGMLVMSAGSGDFNRDGRTDVAAFYNYGNNALGMFVWNAQPDGTFAEPQSRFYTPSYWAGAHLMPAGVGDFNGDGRQDIAAFYGYPENGNAVGLFIWKGNGDGSMQAPELSWYTPSGWWWLLVNPAGTGDFNRDGRTDIAAFYNYGGGALGMFTWTSESTGRTGEPISRFYTPSWWAGEHIRA